MSNKTIMNRHVKIALVMAPILALVSYGITGYFQPKPVQKAGDYELKLSGECKPSDNACVMKSGKFEVVLISSVKQGKRQLALVSNQPISYLSMALARDNDDFSQFKRMTSDNHTYRQIALKDEQKIDEFGQFRLAAHSKKSNYFIENNITF